MQTYQRKVPVVEAWQFIDVLTDDARAWAAGNLTPGPSGLGYLILNERAGRTRVNPGDWVVKNAQGFFERWADEAFGRVWAAQGHYDAADWMGGLCLVCERTPANIMHTHTEDERKAARERTRTQLHRKLQIGEPA